MKKVQSVESWANRLVLKLIVLSLIISVTLIILGVSVGLALVVGFVAYCILAISVAIFQDLKRNGIFS